MRLGLNLGYSGSSLGIDLSMVLRRRTASAITRCGRRRPMAPTRSRRSHGSPRTPTRIKVGTAIMQIPARTPTLTATTALTLDQLSGGRFLLGLGVSGPQVVEGWHGVAVRQAARADARVRRDRARGVAAGEGRWSSRARTTRSRTPGADATGLGKPLRSILHGRADIPIYLAAIGPQERRARRGDRRRVLPMFFSPERMSGGQESLEAGFRAAGGGKSLATFDLAPTVPW